MRGGSPQALWQSRGRLFSRVFAALGNEKMASYNAEKRCTERYDLCLPAIISVVGGPRNARPLALGTRDVSSGGGYFPCDAPLRVDTRVEVGLLIPVAGLKKLGRSGARVKLAGVVVRADSQGMAIRFDRRFRLAPLP